jgi:hypothetical protein
MHPKLGHRVWSKSLLRVCFKLRYERFYKVSCVQKNIAVKQWILMKIVIKRLFERDMKAGIADALETSCQSWDFLF